MSKIVSARITDQPENFFDPMPRVYATVAESDGELKEFFLFEYYPDELTFNPAEFIGLELDQAMNLKGQKDRAFLKTA